MHLSSTQVKKISFVIIIFWNKNKNEIKKPQTTIIEV